MALINRDYAIELIGLTKSFRTWTDRPDSIKSLLTNIAKLRFNMGSEKTTTVLNDISFKIRSGEFVGIMGPNGAGKSTILKIISGIYYPSTGTIRLNGTVAPLIELGAGFHPDLSGYENIFLNAAILGFGKQTTENQVSDILEFAELGEKIHMPVRYYSSGMLARLGFSVATHLPAPILLIDEILAVGDAQFQSKCISKIRELHQAGRTIVLVSHDVEAIAQHCDTALILASKGVFYQGPAHHIRDRYLASLGTK